MLSFMVFFTKQISIMLTLSLLCQSFHYSLELISYPIKNAYCVTLDRRLVGSRPQWLQSDNKYSLTNHHAHKMSLNPIGCECVWRTRSFQYSRSGRVFVIRRFGGYGNSSERLNKWSRRPRTHLRPAMTQNSASKLLNGDTVHRTKQDKNASGNGFVKSHCVFQQQQKRYRRPAEKVRPPPAIHTPGNTLQCTHTAAATAVYYGYSR